MENASKALIIAGAILLAILIIGLGVFIYNQAANSVNDTGMDQVAARQFNGQFEPYINKTIDSTNAKALIDTVNQASQSGNYSIEMSGLRSKNDIQTGHKYIINADYRNGIVSSIEIRDANSTIEEEDIENEEAILFNERFDGLVPTIHPRQKYFPIEISVDNTKELQQIVDRTNKDETCPNVDLEISGEYSLHVDGNTIYPDYTLVDEVRFDDFGYIYYIHASWERRENAKPAEDETFER